MIISGQVGTPSNTSATDGANYPVLQGKQRELLVSQLHGPYLTQTYNGNVFSTNTGSAGVAIPIASTTSPSVVLWNPAGSGRLCVPISYDIAYVSGTTVASSVGFNFLENAGSGVATAAAFSAFNDVEPTNMYVVGNNGGSRMRVAVAATNTLTTAGSRLLTCGFSLHAAVATSAISAYALQYEFKGRVIIPPGIAFYPVGSAASGALFEQTLIWEEIPL